MTLKEYHPATGKIDKQSLYGTYLSSAQRKQRIADKAIHKALDLPIDDDVNVTNVRQSGVNPWIAGVLAIMGVVSGGALVALLDGRDKPQQQQNAADTDTRYGYEFRLGEPDNNKDSE